MIASAKTLCSNESNPDIYTADGVNALARDPNRATRFCYRLDFGCGYRCLDENFA